MVSLVNSNLDVSQILKLFLIKIMLCRKHGRAVYFFSSVLFWNRVFAVFKTTMSVGANAVLCCRDNHVGFLEHRAMRIFCLDRRDHSVFVAPHFVLAISGFSDLLFFSKIFDDFVGIRLVGEVGKD